MKNSYSYHSEERSLRKVLSMFLDACASLYLISSPTPLLLTSILTQVQVLLHLRHRNASPPFYMVWKVARYSYLGMLWKIGELFILRNVMENRGVIHTLLALALFRVSLGLSNVLSSLLTHPRPLFSFDQSPKNKCLSRRQLY